MSWNGGWKDEIYEGFLVEPDGSVFYVEQVVCKAAGVSIPINESVRVEVVCPVMLSLVGIQA